MRRKQAVLIQIALDAEFVSMINSSNAHNFSLLSFHWLNMTEIRYGEGFYPYHISTITPVDVSVSSRRGLFVVTVVILQNIDNKLVERYSAVR